VKGIVNKQFKAAQGIPNCEPFVSPGRYFLLKTLAIAGQIGEYVRLIPTLPFE